MKDKFAFRYDRNTRKGILITKDGEKEINLQKKSYVQNVKSSGSGSGGGGYGLHLI